MTFSTRLLLTCVIGLLAACSQLKETGRAVSQENGVLMDSDEQMLSARKFRITVRGSSVLFEGDAEQAFNRRADEYTRSQGCKGWKLLEFKMGIENTLLGGRRYAVGVVECTS
ncbi:MAG: hypothetical protein JO218_15530 [Burkholderiales bacterium]|nr:hypothetical protein [Burkholderiales bacterium]